MLGKKKKITCVSANPTDPNFCAYPKVFLTIFEQTLLKLEYMSPVEPS